MKIHEAGDMVPGEHTIHAMMDGKVHLRLHPVEFVMEADPAEAAGKQMIEAARVARIIAEELKHIPPEVHGDAQVQEYLRSRLAEITL
jgi:hypothetical protein